MLTFDSVYEDRRGNRILIHSLESPPKERSFRTAGGKRKFKRIYIKATKRKVIIVARTSKARGKKADIIDEDLEELEGLEDLEDLDEEEPEDEDDELEDDEDEDELEDEADDDLEDEEDDDFDDEDDEDEAPAPKKRKPVKAAAKPTKPSRSRTTDGKVGTAEVAAAAGIDSRALRMVLRKHAIPKDEETSRYEWASLESPQVKKILKLIAAGEHKKISGEAFKKLKDRADAKKETKQASPTRTRRKAADVLENGDDPEPAPKPRKRALASKASAKATPAKATTRRRRKVEDEDDE